MIKASEKKVTLTSEGVIGIVDHLVYPIIDDMDKIPKGDMPGDVIKIQDIHLTKAQSIFPRLLELLEIAFKEKPNGKAVIAVHGGSGVGKSEIGSLLTYYLNEINIGSYILSGDNYPHRIPKSNDGERLRIAREYGIKGLVSSGSYTKEIGEALKMLQDEEKDFDLEYKKDYPWLEIYQQGGRKGLDNYLGTQQEIDFDELSEIIKKFKSGDENVFLKRMGREEKELWYDQVNMSATKVMVIEWTHGNNSNLQGVDIPILLNSTPEETLAHRKLRNRDGGVDHPFTTMVLDIEQKLLFSQGERAKIIVLKSGELVSFETYKKLMTNV